VVRRTPAKSRNRHCPQCGTRAKDTWLQARLAQVLDVPYAHRVFTLPHSLNALCGAHPRWVIDTLFACVAQTLNEFAANPRWLGGQPAFTLVLHTWGQELQRHVHVHAVIACGGLAANHDNSKGEDKDEAHWVQPKRSPQFLFPVTALSTVFRGKFMAALQAAHEQGGIANDPQRATLDWAKRHHALYRFAWVVYAKTPLGGPAQVLEYLARYTHRTAISNERIVKIGADQVVFKVRADDKGGKRLVKFDGVEFVRRFLLQAWTAAPGGNSQGLQDVGATGGADSDHAAKHGAAMTAQNVWIGGFFGVAGLHRQGESCAQWRTRLVLGVSLPRVAPAYCRENETLRQRFLAKRLNVAPVPELQTYNPL